MQALSIHHLAAAALLLGGSLGSAQAGSLGASSAAGGSSASGSSASSEASSDSSRRQRTAAGPYRITAVVALADRPGEVRLQLQALAADAPEPEHVLVLPQAVVARHGLAAGQTLTARPQAYGTAFALGDAAQAAFLVLDDAWQRALTAKPVQL